MLTKQEFLDALETFMYKTCGPSWEWSGKDTDDTEITIKLKAWRFKKEGDQK